MQNIQLYIDDQLADLGDDPIQLVFMINELSDVKSQSGNGSKVFKLPYTQRNKIILGYPHILQLKSRYPYRQYPVKLVMNGVEVIPDGVGELQSTKSDGFDFMVLSGNVDFFDSIIGNIYDMSDSTSLTTNYGKKLLWDKINMPYPEDPGLLDNCIFDLKHIANSQTKTSGWLWPVIDYGHVDPVDFSKQINVRQMRPGIFLHTVIDLIIEGTGYSVDTERSSLMRDSLYNKLIVQFSNDEFDHSTDVQNQPDNLGVLAYSSTNREVLHVSVDDPVGKGVFSFTDKRSDPSHSFNGQTYTAPQRMNAIIDLVIPRFYFYGRVNSNPSSVDVKIRIHTTSGDLDTVYTFDLTEFTRDNSPGAGSGSHEQGYNIFSKTTISTTADLQRGDQVSVVYEMVGGRPERLILYSGASLQITTNNKNVLYGQAIQCERILPDISQKDFLKDTLQRFGIICQSNNITKKIAFFSMRDIVNSIPNARDWTSKVVDAGFMGTYQLGNYSQVNFLRYQDDDGIPRNTLPRYFADDKIVIDDRTINPSTPQADMLTSIYGPSINRPWLTGTIAQILKIDPTGDDPTSFSISTAPRLLVDQKVDLRKAGRKSVTFADGDEGNPDTKTVIINDIVSLPYFWKANGEYNLCWCDKGGQPGLRSLYYPEIERILKFTQKIVRYFMLTPRDIAELDLSLPVYLEQDSCYFYVNKVDSWVCGVPVKVELVRIG